MTNRSHRGSDEPRGSERPERAILIEIRSADFIKASGTAPTGRRHDCTRPNRITDFSPLHRRSRPDMTNSL